MRQLAEIFRVPPAATGKVNGETCSVIEGDGSAWDTTCSKDLRENVIIEHIGAWLKTVMIHPEFFVDAHMTACEAETYYLRHRKDKSWRNVVPAIRRSGHRGASTLNWLTNFVCWICATLETPQEACEEGRRYFVCVDGVRRWIVFCFEGDDSILAVSPQITEKCPVYIRALQAWERYGFNMKIFLRANHALFTGYRFAIDARGCTGVYMPVNFLNPISPKPPTKSLNSYGLGFRVPPSRRPLGFLNPKP